MAKRITLTKDQLNSSIGLELLHLCQTITTDGSISKQDVLSLKEWLRRNEATDLPSAEFLRETVSRIIADARVTREEQKELYLALERVLPLEARKRSRTARAKIEEQERIAVKEVRIAKKQRERAERERDSPIEDADFMVAGARYEGRPEIIRGQVYDSQRVFLARDALNPYSPNAIEVRLKNGMQIGFVPEDDAERLAPLLDRGCLHSALVKKVLTGGQYPIPVVVAEIFRPNAMISDAAAQSDVPIKQALPKAAIENCNRSADSSSLVPIIIVCCLVLALIAYCIRSW